MNTSFVFGTLKCAGSIGHLFTLTSHFRWFWIQGCMNTAGSVFPSVPAFFFIPIRKQSKGLSAVLMPKVEKNVCNVEFNWR